MFSTTFSGGAIWWTLTRYRQAWCFLQVKLCDPCLSALKWFVYHARRYSSALLYLYLFLKQLLSEQRTGPSWHWRGFLVQHRPCPWTSHDLDMFSWCRDWWTSQRRTSSSGTRSMIVSRHSWLRHHIRAARRCLGNDEGYLDERDPVISSSSSSSSASMQQHQCSSSSPHLTVCELHFN